jgi:hypothetical protein
LVRDPAESGVAERGRVIASEGLSKSDRRGFFATSKTLVEMRQERSVVVADPSRVGVVVLDRNGDDGSAQERCETEDSDLERQDLGPTRRRSFREHDDGEPSLDELSKRAQSDHTAPEAFALDEHRMSESRAVADERPLADFTLR